MSDFQAYRDRVNATGNVIDNSKQLATEQIMNSPSLKYVKLNDGIDAIPCIVSDKDSFNKREFLFLPDTVINVGDYVHFDTFTYLATDRKRDEIYPELTGELCNSEFLSKTLTTKVLIGHDPNNNRPFYEEIEEVVYTPCLAEYQSFINNNGTFLLPEGRLKITIKYDSSSNLSLNREFNMYESKFKIVDINLTKVIDGIGIATVISEVVT